jgi:hypothetical protein
MEKCKGVMLHDVIPKQADQVPERFLDQYLTIRKTLKCDIIPQRHQRIGSFDAEMNIAPAIFDQPSIEAPATYLEFVNMHLIYAISEMKKIKILRKLADDLNAMRLDLVEKVSQSNTNSLNFDDQMTVCHNDVTCRNIVVDPDTFEITAVLDWEWAVNSFEVFPKTVFVFCCCDYGKLEERFISKLNEAEREWYRYDEEKSIRHYLFDMSMFAISVTFYLSHWLNEDENKHVAVRKYIRQKVKTVENLLNDWPARAKKITKNDDILLQ